MQLDKFIVVYKDGGLPEVWNTYTYQEVYRNNPDHFKGYRILATFNTNSSPCDTASIEQEAERLYPDTKENETVSMGHNGIQDLRRSAHITAARMYMGEVDRLTNENHKLMAEIDVLSEELGELKNIQEGVEKLKAENDKMRKALESEGYCTMCHEKKKKQALLVCDTCYDSFDGDRRSFWDDNFIH